MRATIGNWRQIGMFLPLATIGLVRCYSWCFVIVWYGKSSLYRHCIESGIGLPTGRVHFVLV